MKNYLFFFIFFLIINCAPRNSVYWCGDHPCINKKEKEAYFKKTMIVEVKDTKKKNYEGKSEVDKLLQQARINENKRIKNEKTLKKQTKLDEKKRIKEEKALAKQAKLDEKKRIKEEKALARIIELEDKRRIKDKKNVVRKKIVKKQKIKSEKSIELDSGVEKFKINLNNFGDFVEKITKQNSLRPYPDINDIPN